MKLIQYTVFLICFMVVSSASAVDLVALRFLFVSNGTAFGRELLDLQMQIAKWQAMPLPENKARLQEALLLEQAYFTVMRQGF